MAIAVGTVVLLRRFPLKSARGEEPASVELAVGGVVGDRSWGVVDSGTGEPLRPREHPWLADLRASVDGDQLVVDWGGRRLVGDSLRTALRTALGTRQDGAALERLADPALVAAGAAVHLVSEHAERDPVAAADCDPGLRANVVVRLAAGLDPGAERSWVGAVLGVGAAEVAVTRTPRRCLGVYADVARAGAVTVGDRVLLLR